MTQFFTAKELHAAFYDAGGRITSDYVGEFFGGEAIVDSPVRFDALADWLNDEIASRLRATTGTPPDSDPR